jgi:hypothetical protein
MQSKHNLTAETVERITIPEVWHIQANSKQNAATTFS